MKNPVDLDSGDQADQPRADVGQSVGERSGRGGLDPFVLDEVATDHGGVESDHDEVDVAPTAAASFIPRL